MSNSTYVADDRRAEIISIVLQPLRNVIDKYYLVDGKNFYDLDERNVYKHQVLHLTKLVSKLISYHLHPQNTDLKHTVRNKVAPDLLIYAQEIYLKSTAQCWRPANELLEQATCLSTLLLHSHVRAPRNALSLVSKAELLDLHNQWMDIEENRPPLHLIFIEEPEAHLHAQLQQVFVRTILDILRIDGGDAADCSSQVVITTHSSHILYERGFRPIRYFRRDANTALQRSEVLNLSAFYDKTENPTRDFLECYLKLTHCDLFFADAAVLVEGNVERLLLPQMIQKAAPRLKSTYLSILEIGGAFDHRFRSLIEFLGITALIITDIDSVIGEPAAAAQDAEVEQVNEENEGAAGNRPGTACMVDVVDAVTSNQTLIQWLPRRTKIADLLAATPIERIRPRSKNVRALIRASYQTIVDVTWRDETARFGGRTLEEAFALENLAWCQDQLCADLKLVMRGNAELALRVLVERLHRRIKGASFNKTDFALALLAQYPATWVVPTYIRDGLQWLQDEVAPLPRVGAAQAAAPAPAAVEVAA